MGIGWCGASVWMMTDGEGCRGGIPPYPGIPRIGYPGGGCGGAVWAIPRMVSEDSAATPDDLPSTVARRVANWLICR